MEPKLPSKLCTEKSFSIINQMPLSLIFSFLIQLCAFYKYQLSIQIVATVWLYSLWILISNYLNWP